MSTSPLKLAIEITARTAGLVAATREASGAVQQVGSAAGDAARVEAAASELRTAKLAQLRAAIVPLAGAQRDYIAALARVQVAEREGAISAAERAEAVTRLKAAFAGRVDAISGRSAQSAAAAAEAAALDDLRARYSPLYAAQRQYLATLAEIRQAQAAGALSAGEAAAAIGRTKDGFAAQVAALKQSTAAHGAHGAAMRLSAQDATNLTYQLNDVAVSLASGQNPLMVLIQQGSQITPIFGGVRGTLSALASVLTPLRLAIGGVTAALLAGGAAWASYDASARSLKVAATGLGANSGATAGALEAQARSLDVGLSTRSVREFQGALLATGRIGADSFGSIISIAKNFAATVGTDLDGARDQLAKLFADPAKGAAELRDQYRLLDAATVRQIQRLSEQNRGDEARLRLIDALRPRLVEASQSTHALARAWDAVQRGASNAWDWTGRTIDRVTQGPSKQEQVDWLREQRGSAYISRPQDREWIDREIDRLNALIAAEAEAARAARERSILSDQMAEARSIADASPANRDAARFRALNLEAAKLSGALMESRAGTAEFEELSRALAATTAEMATLRDAAGRLIPTSEKLAEVNRLDIAMMRERDPVARAQIAYERELAQARLDGSDMLSAQARAEGVRSRALAEAEVAMRDYLAGQRQQVAMARTELEALGLSAGARARLIAIRQTEAELADRGVALQSAEAEEARRLAAALADLTSAREREQAVRDTARDQEDHLATLRTEIALIGQSEAARRRAMATLATAQDLRRRDIDPSSGAGRELVARAGMIAEIETQAERYQAAWERMRDGAGSAIDGLVDRIAEGRVSMRDFADWGRETFADLTKTFLQFAVSNPLKNALLGTNLPTMEDAGGVLGQLFGGEKIQTKGLGAIASQAVGSMAVNAGTVTITGGIGGGLGQQLAGASSRFGGDAMEVLKGASNTSQGALEGLQPALQQSVAGLISDVQARFGDASISIQSGFRTVARQAELWAQALDKYGSADEARKWVAPPGKSQHNVGGAVDLGYASPEVMQYAHQRAGAHGLAFPLDNENWHVELANGGRQAAQSVQALAASSDQATTGLKAIEQVAGQATQPGGLGGEAAGTGAAVGSMQVTAQSVTVMGGSGGLPGAPDGGSGMGGEGAAGIAGQARRAVDPLTGMIDRISSTLRSVMSTVTGLIGGIVRGLGSMIGGIVNAIGGLFGMGGFGAATGAPLNLMGAGMTASIGGLYADGGLITGPGGPREDAIAARLPIGAYVVNAAATARHRGLLDHIAGAGTMGGANDNGGSIAARVSAGEYYLPPDVAARHRGLLDSINQGRLPQAAPAFSAGGSVGPVARLPRFADGGAVGGGAVTGGASPASASRPMQVTINNNGEPVRATARQSSGGDVDLLEIVLDRVGAEMASGRYDGSMARFGGQPIARPR